MTANDSAPVFSVVVGLISGRTEDLAECLQALRGQADAPSMEILVPYDDPCADVTRLKAGFPEARFLHADGLDSAAARAGASREHHDTLRTIGLRAVRGRYVARLRITPLPPQAGPRRWSRSSSNTPRSRPSAARSTAESTGS